MKIIKSLEDSGLLLKGVRETIQNEAKEQKGEFLNMLLGTLGASFLENRLAGIGINRAGDGIIRAGFGSKGPLIKKSSKKQKCLILPHRLTNLEIQRYHNKNEPRLDGVYSRDNLLDKIKDGAYAINLDDYSDIWIHWIALYALNNNATYFDSFFL